MGTIAGASRSLELGCHLPSPWEHLPSRLYECAPPSRAVSQGSLLPVHQPSVSCRLLTAALGRRQFTAERKLQENTAGSAGIRSAAPSPGAPALQHVCNPSGHGATLQRSLGIPSSGLGGGGGEGESSCSHGSWANPQGRAGLLRGFWETDPSLGRTFKKCFWGWLAGSVR